MLRSIDYGVERLYLVDNGDVLPDCFDFIGAESTYTAKMGYNAGVAASWNLIIKANMNAPWWLICNNDIKFSPGALEELEHTMRANRGSPTIAKILTHPAEKGSFGAFGINERAVEKVGWFDENYYPIYFEDTDYNRRAQIAGVEMIDIPSDSTHVGNSSWEGDAHRKSRNEYTFRRNRIYHEAKWGGVESPFDTGFPMTYWTPPSLEWIKQNSW
jgi:GT2 family glycosyltransferase